MSEYKKFKEKIFQDVYNDFFGRKSRNKTYEELKKEYESLDDAPEIFIDDLNEQLKKEVSANNEQEDYKIDIEESVKNMFDEIEKLYIEEESKKTLKKIINYMNNYNSGKVQQYIPFDMKIYSNDKITIYKIVSILSAASKLFEYVKNGEEIEFSLYNLEKIEQIEDIYDKKYNIVLIKDFEGILSKDDLFKERFTHELEYKIESNEKNFITILVDDNKEKMNTLIENNQNLNTNIFNYEIIAIKPDVQDIYQEIKERLQKEGEFSEEFELKLLEYISTIYPNIDYNYNQYINKTCEEILFNKSEKFEANLIPKYEKNKTVDEIFKELNELVGLNKVKDMLKDLVNLIELKQKTKDDLKIKNTNLHMVFLGNPGTGKTTVARIVAEILYNLKYIKQNKLIEVSSKDLVAEYVGQTAPKTMSVIEKAIGGVLFIDEAYSLASGNGQGNSFNDEAIATLIQAMENNRDNLVVIFAGYTKEMQDFLNANSGIVSRIGYTVEFEDYTVKELKQIFESIIKKSGFEIKEDALEKVEEILKEYKNTKNFGNARFVRNLYEKTVIKHASNTREKKNKNILKTITKDDISTENLLKM